MNTFGARSTLSVAGETFEIFRIGALDAAGIPTTRLPYSLRVLLENLLRNEDGRTVRADEIRALAKWNPKAEPDTEIAFAPARVLMQDFTGVPAVVDLAAMRDAMKKLGGDPKKINPLVPAELVIDHSVQVDEAGHSGALSINADLEFSRNKERYAFLRWGAQAFDNFKVVPPDTGIVHQVNLEYLARVVFVAPAKGSTPARAYPDTVVGTDSHTTMINGVGVLGWGVGGIEAEAALLGQPVSMLIPQVVGFRLAGKLPEGATATDLVLTVTQQLRKKGVVGKFVEFFGPGLAELSLADRATIANMAPEYGATCGIFPVDAETLRYLRLSGRTDAQIALVEAYAKAQGLFHDASTPEAEYTDVLSLDLSTIVPSLAGPKRPQDRVALTDVKKVFQEQLVSLLPPAAKGEVKHPASGDLDHGKVVIAAITSCTNTSNPSVLVAAGLVAKKAAERGLTVKPWVKTSLAPGSQVVTTYLKDAGLLPYLEQLKFHVIGYGCTTCIGNSGPIAEEHSKTIQENNLVVASVLSGNRNFEGRVHADVRANFLASPPLVVAYAIAGRVDLDLTTEAIGTGKNGEPVFLKDIWPSQAEVSEAVEKSVRREMYEAAYAKVYEGDHRWQGLDVPTGETYAWDSASTYVKHPPYFEGMTKTPAPYADVKGARVLAVLGDSITTDHISPAGNIKKDAPAGKYLLDRGVAQKDFNQYGARRGNDDVMVRGTFANIRLKNRLAPGTEGGVTRHLPDGAGMSIFEASQKYVADGVPLLVLAGKEYGSGSSRDWAAKGPYLLGIKVVVAESYERIHRSNLVGMGIVPLEFPPGQNAETLGLTGEEVFEVLGVAEGLATGFAKGREATVRATGAGGKVTEFRAKIRVDTPQEIQYVQNGGILQYVLRQLA